MNGGRIKKVKSETHQADTTGWGDRYSHAGLVPEWGVLGSGGLFAHDDGDIYPTMLYARCPQAKAGGCPSSA